MATRLYINGSDELKEQIIGVPAGTIAKLEEAHAAYHDERSFEQALREIDPTGNAIRLCDIGGGLNRFQATEAFLRQNGLSYVQGETNDPTLVRALLDAQRRWADFSTGVVLGDPAELAQERQAFNDTIDRLIAALDRGVPFGLEWA